MMKSILTLTMNPAVDVSASVESVFPEHKLRCDSMRNDPGGGGINVSRAIKKLGGESLAQYCCGGPSGAILRVLLDSEKIRHQPIEISGWTRQNLTVLETTTAQQYRFVLPGPIILEAEWRGVLEDFQAMEQTPELIVASGSLSPGVPDDFYGRLARIIREKNGRLIVDTSGHALPAAIREGVFLIKPSLRELRIFAQSDLEHEIDQDKTVMDIINAGRCEVAVVSLGAAGVLWASKEGCERLRSPSVPVRSKVGAGDSMVAGIVLGLARGYALRDSIRFGVAAGAAAVMSPGTQLCRREDAERLYKQIS